MKPVVGGQSSSSFVSSVIKTNVPLNIDDHAHKDLLLQRYGERIEKLSQQDKLSKFCMDAGFLNVVEIGHCSLTKVTSEFSQFTDAVACLVVSTLCQETKKHLNREVGSEGTPKLDPFFEVATCCLHGKYGVDQHYVYDQRQFSLLGQNFSWLKQIGHEFEQQRAGNLRSAVRTICVETECG